MPKVIIRISLQMLQRTGTDYSLCPTCKSCKMERVTSYLNHNGTLVNIKDLNRNRTKNKVSPPMIKTRQGKRYIIKILFMKTQAIPKNMGRGTYVQVVQQKVTTQNWLHKTHPQSTNGLAIKPTKPPKARCR